MNILIFGGTRFFGRQTLAKCLLAGHMVTYVSRRQISGEEKLEGLIGEREQLLNSLRGRVFDIVFDFSCYNEVALEQTLCIVQASHYILVSSAWVTQLLSNVRSFSDNEKQYVISKHRAEKMLERRAHQFDAATVLRFPIIMGLKDHTGRLDYLASRIYEGKPITVCSERQKKIMMVCVEDAANLLLKLTLQNDDLRQFHSLDCIAEVIEYDRLLQIVASTLQVQLRQIYSSFDSIKKAFPLFFEIDPFFRESGITPARDQAFKLFSVPVTRIDDWVKHNLRDYYPGAGVLTMKSRKYPWLRADFLESEEKWNALNDWQ